MNWKEIETPFECNRQYFVNEAGQLLSVAPNGKRRLLKGKVTEGSLWLDVCMKGNPKVRKVLSIAQLVAEAFIPKPPLQNLMVMHINGNSKDNSVNNLLWTTRESFGARHEINLRSQHNNQEKWSKLTAAQVSDIVMLVGKGKTRKWCAQQYGVSDMQITRIVRGENWKQINQQ